MDFQGLYCQILWSCPEDPKCNTLSQVKVDFLKNSVNKQITNFPVWIGQSLLSAASIYCFYLGTTSS